MLGYAARFPGAADAGEFWRLMAEAEMRCQSCQADRWDADEFFDPDPDAPGKMVARRAGFVDDVAGFDAPFFGVSAREAMFMDPQHRLMLETAWSAIEHAGMAPSALAGTQTGVFMGLSTHEFAGMIVRLSRLEDIDFYSGTGCSPAAGAGRISFRLGLEGAGHDRGYGVQLVVGGAAPGLPGARLRRVRSGAGRRGERDPHPDPDDQLLPCADVGARTGGARRSTRPPMAMFEARGAAWWCSSASPTRCATGTRFGR